MSAITGTAQRTNALRTYNEMGTASPRRHRRMPAPAPVRSRAIASLPEPESETAFYLRQSFDLAARLRRVISE